MKTTILIVDDEKSIRETLKIILTDVGYKVYTAIDGLDALEQLKSTTIDLLLTDLRMPKMDGIELMKRVVDIDPSIETILISAYSDIRAAVKAVKMGAFDYLEKSFSNDDLLSVIEKALERKNALKDKINLTRELSGKYNYEGIIAKSDKMLKLFYIINRIADSKANILITGESGVGKDLFAELVHKKSSRNKNNFVAINCGAIPENLIEAELFGYEKGSFTGAYQQRKGKFELADNGTLFLDEIGELPLHMQVKFLRVLQERQVNRIGSEQLLNVDVRIVAATNKNLLNEVKNGNFREDLYYRLNVVNIEIPPLRERKEDISILAENFMLEFSNAYNKKLKYIDVDAMNLLFENPWVGNVRELRNVIERAVLLSGQEDEVLMKYHLFTDIGDTNDIEVEQEDSYMTLKEYEKIIIRNTLIKFNGNKSKVADVLGIKRQTLYNKIKEYDLEEM